MPTLHLDRFLLTIPHFIGCRHLAGRENKHVHLLFNDSFNRLVTISMRKDKLIKEKSPHSIFRGMGDLLFSYSLFSRPSTRKTIIKIKAVKAINGMVMKPSQFR
jgi:hypothetical protein